LYSPELQSKHFPLLGQATIIFLPIFGKNIGKNVIKYTKKALKYW